MLFGESTVRRDGQRQAVAIKAVRCSEAGGREAAEREEAVLRRCSREYVAELLDVAADVVGKDGAVYYCLVLEKGEMNLQEQVAVWTECGRMQDLNTVRPCGASVAAVVNYLHSVGIVWADVKPQNFVRFHTPSGVVWKGIDMDAAVIVLARPDADVPHCQQIYLHSVTPRYASPEVAAASIAGSLPSLRVDRSRDHWALGMLLYMLYSGGSPHPARPASLSDEALLAKLAVPHFTAAAAVNGVHEAARDVLRSLLEGEPARRCAGPKNSLADMLALRTVFTSGGSTLRGGATLLRAVQETCQAVLAVGDTVVRAVGDVQDTLQETHLAVLDSATTVIRAVADVQDTLEETTLIPSSIHQS